MNKFLIQSHARIHLGFLELNPKAKRIFGSIGLTISKYKTKIEFRSSKTFAISSCCIETEKSIQKIIKKLNCYYDLKPCKIFIKESIPRHSGLGSGTQLSLLIGKGLTKLSKKNVKIETLSQLLNRGNRSGIGIESFKKGGFIVDAGRNENTKLPPIIFNSKWPTSWKILLLIDKESIGIHGKREIEEFKKVSNVNKKNSLSNYKTLVTEILPSIIEKDFITFCKGIQKIQNNTAKVFSCSQGGMYLSRKIEKIFNELEKNKMYGYGQSSWGPTGFIICENVDYQDKVVELIDTLIKIKNIKGLKLEKIEAQNKGYLLSN